MSDDDFDDLPRIRLWGDSRPGPFVRPHTDPFSPSVLLSQLPDLRGKVSTPSKAPETEKHVLQLQIMRDAEGPFDGLQITVRQRGGGFSKQVTLDGEGRASVDVPDDGSYEVDYAEAPKLPPLPPPHPDDSVVPPTPMPYLGRVLSETAEVRPGRPATLVVRRPRVQEVVLDGWGQDSGVMRWGGMRPRADRTVATAQDVFRAALPAAKGHTVVVAGHADPAESDASNLAKLRATSVQLFASGDLEGWAADAHAHANKNDFDCALIACAKILGEPVPKFDDRRSFVPALQALRNHASIASKRGPGLDDWRAVAKLYDQDLATSVPGLADLRASITWADPTVLSMGGDFPTEPEDGLAKELADRRASFLVFGQKDEIDLALDSEGREVYDGTYRRTVLPTLGQSHNAERTACVQLVGMLFELNKAFLLPAALEGIRLLSHMYESMPGSEILVVGHTDRTGKKFRNDSLSLQRAEAIIAYMTDDVDVWLGFYTKATDESRRWGATQDLAMLSALPREGTPYYAEDHDAHSVVDAVKRFQSEHGLFVDGDIGPITRRELVRDYMALDETTLPADVTAVAHGCGENFPAVPTEDDVEELQNRRVEVFFFRDGISPSPAGSNSTIDASDYPAWKAAVEEERTFTPSVAGRGTLLLGTDIDPELVDLASLVFCLRSVDGAYERELPATAATSDEGGLVLEFRDIPMASYLTFSVRTADGAETVVFDDVPFPELARQVPNDEAIVDPFTNAEST